MSKSMRIRIQEPEMVTKAELCYISKVMITFLADFSQMCHSL